MSKTEEDKLIKQIMNELKKSNEQTLKELLKPEGEEAKETATAILLGKGVTEKITSGISNLFRKTGTSISDRIADIKRAGEMRQVRQSLEQLAKHAEASEEHQKMLEELLAEKGISAEEIAVFRAKQKANKSKSDEAINPEVLP